MSIKPDINLTVDEDIVLWHSISRGDKKAFDDLFYEVLYLIIWVWPLLCVSRRRQRSVTGIDDVAMGKQDDFCAGYYFLFFTTISDYFCQT